VLTIGLGVATALLFAVGAEARTEQVRWTHPNPAEVQTFQVHVGPSPRAYTQTIDVGKPARSAAGVYTYDLVVPDTAVVYLAVTATGPTRLRSAFSNEQVRNPAATGGGGTPGGGTGGGQTPGSGGGGTPGTGGGGEAPGTGGGGGTPGTGGGGESPGSGGGAGGTPGSGTPGDGGEATPTPSQVDPTLPQAPDLGAPGQPQIVR
jgi:hypothetical protein